MNKKDSLVARCKFIEDYSCFNAQMNFKHSSKCSDDLNKLRFIPTVITLLSIAFVTIRLLVFKAGFPDDLSSIIGLFVSILSAFYSVMNLSLASDSNINYHKDFAKVFTVLRHKARVLKLEINDCSRSIEILEAEYNTLVSVSPITDDKKIFAEVNDDLENGVHD